MGLRPARTARLECSISFYGVETSLQAFPTLGDEASSMQIQRKPRNGNAAEVCTGVERSACNRCRRRSHRRKDQREREERRDL